jgi:lipid II:glycine glycyltransferase (peptidoglycan interpeptide bridge formation enzyme)
MVSFAASRWPSVELEPWIYRRGSDAVAAVLVMVQRFPLGTGKLAIVKWGPILANELDPSSNSIHSQTTDHLIEEYADRRCMMLSIMPRVVLDSHGAAFETLISRGFRAGSTLPFPNRYVVKVLRNETDQRKNFAQKWRYHLNKSETENLVFSTAPPSDLPRFAKLYEAMSNRKNFPDYSGFATLPSLFANSPEMLQPKLFFVQKDNVDVAGAVIFAAGRTAVYLYGATTDDALPLRAGYFMQARIISWLREHSRCAWYDLGGSDGFEGLHRFKKGMVGAKGLIIPVPPIANFASSRRAQFAGTLAYAMRDGFQQLRKHVKTFRTKQAQPDLEAGQ